MYLNVICYSYSTYDIVGRYYNAKGEDIVWFSYVSWKSSPI